MNEAGPSNFPILILAVPFLVAWLVGVVSWFVGVTEIAAIYLLRDLLFDRGRVALHREFELSPPASPLIGQRIELDRLHLRFTSPTRAIFGPRYRSPGVTSFKFTSPVKGVVSWFGSKGEITVRHSLGLITFTLAWLAGWTIGSIGAAIFVPNREELVAVAPMALIGGLGGYAMYRLFLWQGRSSARFVADEVIKYLRS